MALKMHKSDGYIKGQKLFQTEGGETPPKKSQKSMRLGSQSSEWCKKFVGRLIDRSRTNEWYDFSEPEQVIFGFPVTPGTYAKILPSKADCGFHDIQIFLFVATEDSKITDISYSVIEMNNMGCASELEVELFPPDVKAATELVEGILK
ncbi:MAG: hypothetical protein ACFFCW_27755 [Candidatus Hodarchaeota archaeon]